MRKCTDKFYEGKTNDHIEADIGNVGNVGTVGIEAIERERSSIVMLTKQQAREFAKQLLEMTEN